MNTVMANLILNLVNAIVANAKSDEKLKAAFLAAGPDQKDTIKATYAARVSISLGISYEQALYIVTDKRRLTKSAKPGDDLMTQPEENAVSAAAGWLTTKRRQWGIATTSKRGAHNQAGKAKAGTKQSRGQKAAATRRTNAGDKRDKIEIAAPQDVGVALLRLETHVIDMVFRKNENHVALNSDLARALRAASEKHLANLQAIVAKFTPKG